MRVCGQVGGCCTSNGLRARRLSWAWRGMVRSRPQYIHEVADEAWVAGDRGGRVIRWWRVGLLDARAGGHCHDGAQPGQDRQEITAHPTGRVGPGWDAGGAQVLFWSGDPPEVS